jgi:hypothetical protein
MRPCQGGDASALVVDRSWGSCVPSSAIYVETRISAPLERLWTATQEPQLHARWDVRFSSITYADGTGSDGRPRAFRYALTVAPGFVIAGTGASAGERRRPDGTCTSALRFASAHPLSLIREGSGWWRYVPQADGSTRFLTGYDYRPGWGPLGPSVDRLFRPLLGWATAWSFDRLRRWLDEGIDPAAALRWSLAGAGLRVATVAGATLALGRPGRVSRLAGLGLAVAAGTVPPFPRAPRAGRCLRRPPDRLGTRAPRLLEQVTGWNEGGRGSDTPDRGPDATDRSRSHEREST